MEFISLFCAEMTNNILASEELFPIPEQPESEVSEDGMWSAALGALLTALRLLAPATLIALFWGNQSFVAKFLRHIDRAIRSVINRPSSQADVALHWLRSSTPGEPPATLTELWARGGALCAALDAALPGCCDRHRSADVNVGIGHAQWIAERYLGVEPVFSKAELNINKTLNQCDELKLALYLLSIKNALEKLSPPVSKPGTPRCIRDIQAYSFDYVARGTGLSIGFVNKRVAFKIYPTAQQGLSPSDISVLIRGPNEVHGSLLIPAIFGRSYTLRNAILGIQTKSDYENMALPITHGTGYLRDYKKTDMKKVYYIPKIKENIDLSAEVRHDHVKISYIPHVAGRYEVSLVSKGCNIVGSPFNVNVTTGRHFGDQSSTELEDDEECEIIDIRHDRKVLFRIVDFVTEKMLLMDDGRLIKISEQEANRLLNGAKSLSEGVLEETATSQQIKLTSQPDLIEIESKRITSFRKQVEKVKIMLNVCNQFRTYKAFKTKDKPINDSVVTPDIVTSTINENTLNLITEHPMEENYYSDKISIIDNTDDFHMSWMDNKYTDIEERSESVKIIVDPKCKTPISTEYNNTNPFIDVMMERPRTPVYKILTDETHERPDSVYLNEDEFGKNIDTTNYEQQILCLKNTTESLNPIVFNRIVSDEITILSPPIVDFKIGAPVSLPPLLRAHSPEPDMDSIIQAPNLEEALQKYDTKVQKLKVTDTKVLEPDASSVFTTPPLSTQFENDAGSEVSKIDQKMLESASQDELYESFDSKKDVIIIQELEQDNESENQVNNQGFNEIFNDNIANACRMDMWDSAYVSIDDNHSPPGSTTSEGSNKNNLFDYTDNVGSKYANPFLMGPAEREIWQSHGEPVEVIIDQVEDNKSFKIKPTPTRFFSPIEEENDSVQYSTMSVDINICNSEVEQIIPLSSGVNLMSINKQEENKFQSDESVTLIKESDEPDEEKHIEIITTAFEELNETYHDYFPNSEIISLSPDRNEHDYMNNKVSFKRPETYEKSVNSASAPSADVKRQNEQRNEKTMNLISEVQRTLTESFISASQAHQSLNDTSNYKTSFDTMKENQLVNEKRKFWDEKIKQFEESKTLNKTKKRITTKASKQNDSIGKKRGKAMAKHYINSIENDEQDSNKLMHTEEIIVKHETFFKELTNLPPENNIVNARKSFWNEKSIENDSHYKSLDSLHEPHVIERCKRKMNLLIAPHLMNVNYKSRIDHTDDDDDLIAFETSPKRFFGKSTNKQNILERIDAFLGPAETTNQENVYEEEETKQLQGIVKKNIMAFSNISKSMVDLSGLQREVNHIDYTNKADNESKCDIKKIPAKLITNLSSTNELPLVTTKTPTNKVDCQNPITHKNVNRVSETAVVIKEKPPIMKVSSPQRFKNIRHLQKHLDHDENVCKVNAEDIRNSQNEDTMPINVRSVISLFENSSVKDKVRKTSLKRGTLVRRLSKPFANDSAIKCSKESMVPRENHHLSKTAVQKAEEIHKVEDTDDITIEIVPQNIQDATNEIADTKPSNAPEQEDSNDDFEYIKCKERFKQAKRFFQSLNKDSGVLTSSSHDKLNELSYHVAREKKKTISTERLRQRTEAFSAPTSDNEYDTVSLGDLYENNQGETKLVKISEKFQVDDLFHDVIGEGRLSRQGSFKGIPHKSAVLAAFRSMENLTEKQLSSYEITLCQLSDFAKENAIVNAQTYHTEYPYLPKTDPNKYRSRFDAQASGLISRKELLNRTGKHIGKQRRKSVPGKWKLNESFTATL